ncbi:flagellar biosynthetic protein FliR [Coralloluteibacterium thermophilus]|uniref:Flagellar biosynthetic protein FliR n=1 Tax=Coralloluteibacterium thermophilum TaxID=2707049 RepID=A0ABV9NID6_9GAMM
MDAVTATVIDGSQLFAMLATIVWTLLRVGALFMVAPLIGTPAVSVRVRLVLSVAIAVVLTPLIPAPPLAQLDAATVLNVLREMAIGAAMGFLLKLVFEAGALAGELVAQGMALSFAQMSDPMRGVSSGVVGQWFYIAFGLLFFAANGHIALIDLLLGTYRTLPIGAPLPDVHALLQAAPMLMSQVLRVGVSIALPVMIAMLAVNVSFGVLSRASPALNTIAIGLPGALLVGLFLLTALVGQLAAPVQALFDEAFRAAADLVR